MTEFSRPFMLSSGGYDELQTREYFSWIMRQDGYIEGVLDELEVYPKTPNDMSVNVKTGGAWIQGAGYNNTAVVNLPIDAADASNNRIDRIVLRLTVASPNSAIVAAVLKGTNYTAGNEVAPALTQDATNWELSLAQVLVTHGITSITGTGTSLITDERQTTYCGVACPTLGHFSMDASGNLVTDGSNISMANAGQIIGLVDPTLDQDADTKGARDAAIAVSAAASQSGMKMIVRCATTAAITLASDCSNNSVIDGITIATGDRVLIKNQATGTENGIYVAGASGTPTRAADFNSAALALGAIIPVMEGTVNGFTHWQCTNTTINWGVTNLTFASRYYKFMVASASDTLKASSDAEVTTTSTTAIWKKSLYIPGNHIKGGVYRIKVDLKVSSGTATGSIYVNGHYVDSQTENNAAYQTHTFDATIPETPHTIELWLNSNSGSYTASAQNFRVYCDETLATPEQLAAW